MLRILVLLCGWYILQLVQPKRRGRKPLVGPHTRLEHALLWSRNLELVRLVNSFLLADQERWSFVCLDRHYLRLQCVSLPLLDIRTAQADVIALIGRKHLLLQAIPHEDVLMVIAAGWCALLLLHATGDSWWFLSLIGLLMRLKLYEGLVCSHLLQGVG